MIAAVVLDAPAAAAPPPMSPAERLTVLRQTVSPSRLTLFLQCRLKFYFRYVAQIAKPKTPALHVGSSRLVETYFRESKIPDSLKPDAVEVPVETDLRAHGLPTLIGVLDLVQAGRIIDFKTSSTTPHAEKVAHTTEVQTSSYAVLYREATGRRETGIELHHLIKLKNPKLVITPLPAMSDAQQNRLFRLIAAYVTGLDREDFVPSPGLSCVSCEFFNECRAWH